MCVPKWLVVSGLSVPTVLVWLGILGCEGPAARRQRLGSPNPLDRAQAVVEVYALRDGESVPKVVDLLDDSDGAVRLYAINALRRLCGEDFGYRYYESASVREAAVRRWRDALRAGVVRLAPASRPARDERGSEDQVDEAVPNAGSPTAADGLAGAEVAGDPQP